MKALSLMLFSEKIRTTLPFFSCETRFWTEIPPSACTPWSGRYRKSVCWLGCIFSLYHSSDGSVIKFWFGQTVNHSNWRWGVLAQLIMEMNKDTLVSSHHDGRELYNTENRTHQRAVRDKWIMPEQQVEYYLKKRYQQTSHDRLFLDRSTFNVIGREGTTFHRRLYGKSRIFLL